MNLSIYRLLFYHTITLIQIDRLQEICTFLGYSDTAVSENARMVRVYNGEGNPSKPVLET